MTKQPNPQSQKRFTESLASLFRSPEELKSHKRSLLFIKSSSDVGVTRNGGRNGARFAPQSFLSYFKKLTQDHKTSSLLFSEVETASIDEEKKDFHQAQQQEAQRITEILCLLPEISICHLGGGHDHIYPLLKALGRSNHKIIVVNVDAHADMRTDEDFNSGTPFRQFAENYVGEFHLFQIGLHPFANSFSTLAPLKNGSVSILWRNEIHDLEKVTSLFQQIKSLMDDKTIVLFSLDADALNGSLVPGVSAVNGNGLDKNELQFLWKKYHGLQLKHPPVIGIYELNPVYDTLSMTSMRSLGNFLFEIL
jgi:formiminoglutamase